MYKIPRNWGHQCIGATTVNNELVYLPLTTKVCSDCGVRNPL